MGAIEILPLKEIPWGGFSHAKGGRGFQSSFDVGAQKLLSCL